MRAVTVSFGRTIKVGESDVKIQFLCTIMPRRVCCCNFASLLSEVKRDVFQVLHCENRSDSNSKILLHAAVDII